VNISMPWFVAVPLGITLIIFVLRGLIVPKMSESRSFALALVALSWILMLVIVFGDRI